MGKRRTRTRGLTANQPTRKKPSETPPPETTDTPAVESHDEGSDESSKPLTTKKLRSDWISDDESDEEQGSKGEMGNEDAEKEEDDESESESETEAAIQAKFKPGRDLLQYEDGRLDSDEEQLIGSDAEVEDGSDEDEGEGQGDESDDLEEDLDQAKLAARITEEEDPQVLSQRIQDVLSILADFRAYQQKQVHHGKTPGEVTARSAFIDQLTGDCAAYYGYLPSLITLFLSLFSPHETVEFLEANEKPRPTVIRTNTLRTRRKDLAEQLGSRGVNLELLNLGEKVSEELSESEPSKKKKSTAVKEHKVSKVGLKILDSSVPVGATPEYLAGHYMLQSASSFTPVMALDPQPHERILDVASAPGGKTSYVSQLMQNTGVIVANDTNPKRMKATISNLARLGCQNVIHVNQDGRDFPKLIGGFDRVLLDAPCSGLGVISRDFSVKVQRNQEDIDKNSVMQKQLLLAAIDAVSHKSKSGGIVVYSTCSISVEENERVVQYALDNRNVRIIDSGLQFGRNGLTKYQRQQFHPSMKLARRFYPHVHNMDGFFVAKLEKFAPSETDAIRIPQRNVSKKHKRKQKRKRREEERQNRHKPLGRSEVAASNHKQEVDDATPDPKSKKKKLKKSIESPPVERKVRKEQDKKATKKSPTKSPKSSNKKP